MLRALDLFCGAGGASAGLARAGFDVTGVDVTSQSRYPFRFVQADALSVSLDGYDLIWASPPCQHYCSFSRNLGTAERHADLVATVRARLIAQGTPYIIENVVGAPLKAPFMLCGTMFGLNVLRHRLFETSWPIATLMPPCRHTGNEVPVYGNGTPQYYRRKLGRNIGAAEKAAAMGVSWMTRDELKLAIPPAYAEWMAREWLIEKAAQRSSS